MIQGLYEDLHRSLLLGMLGECMYCRESLDFAH